MSQLMLHSFNRFSAIDVDSKSQGTEIHGIRHYSLIRRMVLMHVIYFVRLKSHRVLLEGRTIDYK